MKVAQISKADEFGGGASRVAADLCRLFNDSKNYSKHFVSWAGKGYGESRVPLYGSHEKFIRGLHLGTKLAGFPELIPFEMIPEWKSKRLSEFDLLHFHDLSSAISPTTPALLGRTKPVIWTIHDASPFTGGCLYPFECSRFKASCGACPQLGEWPIDIKIDTTRLLHQVKKRVHKSGNVKAITPSRWMSDLAFSSGMFEMPPRVVPNGVDEKLFRNSGKEIAKKTLGIPLNRHAILISAGNVLDERKGTSFAIEAVRKLSHLRPFLVIVGNPSPALTELLDGIDHKTLGYLSDPGELAQAYRAADIYLFCSLADNQPLSVLETMASGTPTVGFATGGIPEMVANDESGLLVKPRDIPALVRAIEVAFHEDRHKAWGLEARATVERNFTYQQMKRNHDELYKELIESYESKQAKA